MQETNGAARGVRASTGRIILGTAAFRELLTRERARADRLRQPFAVIAFDAVAGRDEARFWKAVEARLRATDAIGALDDGRTGILLRGATVRSAVRLAEEMQGLSAPVRSTCMIYGHPPFEYGLRADWGPRPVTGLVPHALPEEGLEPRPGQDPVSAVDLMPEPSESSG